MQETVPIYLLYSFYMYYLTCNYLNLKNKKVRIFTKNTHTQLIFQMEMHIRYINVEECKKQRPHTLKKVPPSLNTSICDSDHIN